MSPQSLRRDVEEQICLCALEGNHEALAIYRDHGVPLAIFERYDCYLDDPSLYDASPQTILYGKGSFPNTLKPLGKAMLGFGSKYPEAEGIPLISKEDFVETMNVLRSMGGHRYVSEPQYVAMMFKDMYLSNFIGTKDKEKMVEAMSHFLESGGVSLSRDVDSELTFDESITKCLDTISRLNKKPWTHNPILNFAMDAEIKNGISNFDPALVFGRFLDALRIGQPQDVWHLGDKTNLRAIFSRLHELSPLERSPTEIIMGRRTDFTPLQLLKTLEEPRPGKKDPTLIERLFQVALTTGLDMLTSDPKHMMNLIRHYEREGIPSLRDHIGFNAELKKCVASLSFDAAVKLADKSFGDARDVVFEHAKKLLTANKTGELAAAKESTIEILFKSFDGQKHREALGLELKDAFANKCKLTRSMSFRADSFSKDLGL
jgi:hypothetical protein